MNPALRSGRRTGVRRALSATVLALALAGTGAATASSAVAASDGTTPDKLFQQIRAAAEAQGYVPKSVDRQPSVQSTPTMSPQIIGGSQTTIAAAPYMLQLWYFVDSSNATFCAGTLVAPNKVLTAAHCVYGMDWHNKGVVIGGTATLADPNAKPVGVKRQWVNPGYNPSSTDNDVAVLTLDGTLPFSTAKIAANTDSALYAAGTNAKVYGWGLTKSAPDGLLSDVLKTATLPLQPDATCDAALSASLGQDLFVAGHMVCAGPASTGDDATTTTTCSGDSGGPLVVNGRVVGIVSWGVSDTGPDGTTISKVCGSAGTYPVFTKVSAYTGVTLARVGDTDWSGDGRADVFARYKTGGTARVYKGATLTTSSSAGSGWGSFNKVLQTDLNRDGVVDYVVRTTSGALYWRHKSGSTMVNTKISSSWGSVKQIITPGDVTGDALPDLMSVTSNGYLYVYPGKGNGTFGAAKKLGTGWLSYAQVVGHGDYTGDGRPDLIARTSGGATYLFTSSTTGTFGSRKLVSSSAFKTATAIAATGDVNGDGKADLVTRTGSGTLWLYKGNGNGTFASAVKAATGTNSFNLFG